MPAPDYTSERQRMVNEQIAQRGIQAPRVLEAMSRVPRECFVPPELAEEAYSDRALSIDCEQTISQPYIVALMSQALEISGGERVLEIGTGSGYQAAVLAEMGAQVITIERHPQLHAQAARVLQELGYDSVRLLLGDGTRGWPAGAPYDRIIVTAVAEKIPRALVDQLVEGGVLVMPLGSGESQMLKAIHRDGNRLHVRELSSCRFVPLVSASSKSPPM